jgi:dihydroflavonol-4-reductase
MWRATRDTWPAKANSDLAAAQRERRMVTLVTGATGLLGNNVVRSLLANGGRVRVLARKQADPRPLAGLDVQVICGDVRDRSAVVEAVRGADCVVHAAGYVRIGWSGLDTARAVNVEGTRHVAQAALGQGAKLVHVSTIDALGSATSSRPADEDTAPNGGVLCPYCVTKREAEQVVLDLVGEGLHASIVNPAFMIGPYDWKPSSGRMLLQVARGWGLFAPLGTNTYCDVRDVVDGILAALRRGQPGRRYILGGQVLSYFQAWRIFAQVTGGTPPVFPAGPMARMAAGYFGDLTARLTGREPDVNSAATAISGQKRNFTSARAEAELGYRPRPLSEAAAAAWKWFRENGYA